MVDSTVSSTDEPGAEDARSHFSNAMNEARAGAEALAGEYCDKVSKKKHDLGEEARAYSDDARSKADAYVHQAKAKAGEYAVEGKSQASKAIVRLSKVIDDNVAYIDDKAGPQYGDYAREASKTMKDGAAKLEEKSFEELGEDARSFVRANPVLAVGMGVFSGYLLGRLFSKSK